LAQHRVAAIYLWGYAAEMTLKASYFALVGFADSQPITMADLRMAQRSAPMQGVSTLTTLHDLHGWTDLLLATRASLPGKAYARPRFGNRVMKAGHRIHRLWREWLRYHKNTAYEYELGQVRMAAQWLLANSLDL
jgi:hypothetical protein